MNTTTEQTGPLVKIRASLLPSYNDCPRRSAARILFRELETEGYSFRQRPALVSGCVGTGLHGAQKYALVEKSAGRVPDLKTGVESGMAAFMEGIVDGVEYDETTKNGNHAYEQIHTMSRALFAEVIPDLDPAIDHAGQPIIEAYREAILMDGFLVTGSLDVETVQADIGDTKTGKSGLTYHAQLGGYSLLKKANVGTGARQLFVDHVPRVSIKKAYPGTTRIAYDTKTCESAAYFTLKRIARDVQNYRATQSPWVFPANNMSQLCSPKYCTAHGTPWCGLTGIAQV